MKIAFTGRRKFDNTIDFMNNTIWKEKIDKLYDFLFDLMNKNKEEEYHFISGGALGTDLLAFGCIETFKKEHKQFKIKNEIAIPFIGYEEKWDKKWKDILTKCLESADIRVNVEELEEYKTNNVYQKLQKRNEYMIDQCDLLVALWDNIEKGGTYNAIKYSKKNQKEIKFI